MRRIVLWLASTVTVVVLLFGYHTSTDKTSPAAASSSAGSNGAGSSSAPASSSASPSAGSATSPSTGSGSGGGSTAGTYTGSVAQTRWGPVQVQLTVRAGKITGATVLQQPEGNPRDAEINATALPVLVRETLDAQSADIDMVSGATVTSTGYLQSLQAALDEAGL